MDCEDNIPGDTSTNSFLAVGSSVSHDLDCAVVDFHRMTLDAEKTYELVYSDDYNSSHDFPSGIIRVFDRTGVREIRGWETDSWRTSAVIQFSPRVSGDFYVAAFDLGSPAGTIYDVALTEVDVDDLESQNKTFLQTPRLLSGFGRVDELEVDSDTDVFDVVMERGRRYRIEVMGSDSESGTLGDPYLQFSMDGQKVFDFNSGFQRDALLEVTATSANGSDIVTGELLVGGHGSGTYRVLVTQVDDFENGFNASYGLGGFSATVQGSIGGPGDTDWFQLPLVAGGWYEIDMKSAFDFNLNFGLDAPLLFVRNPAGEIVQLDRFDVLSEELPSASLRFRAEESGLHHLIARSSAAELTGNYEISFRQVQAPVFREIRDFSTVTDTFEVGEAIGLDQMVHTGTHTPLWFDVVARNAIQRDGEQMDRFEVHRIAADELDRWTVTPVPGRGDVRFRAVYDDTPLGQSRWLEVPTHNHTLSAVDEILSGQYWDEPVQFSRVAELPAYFEGIYSGFEPIQNFEVNTRIREAAFSWKVIDSEFSTGNAEINVFIADGVDGFYDAYLPGPDSGGDIVLSREHFSGIDSLTPELYHQILRAFGHAVGLNDNVAVSNTFTTMSSLSTTGQTPTSQDLHLLRSIYGDNYFNSNRRFDSLLPPEITTETRGRHFTYAGAGFDYPALDARGSDAETTELSLREGDTSWFRLNDEFGTSLFSIVNGIGVSYRDAIGTDVRDVVTGNAMANTIRTLGGNDFINPGPGDDVMTGSAGDDFYAFTPTTGDDTIREYEGASGSAGRDAIRFIDDRVIDHGRTELEELFVFKRDGNDLVINLTLDAPVPQASMKVENMGYGRHRVERLELTDVNGDVVWAASLVDLYGQMANGQQRRFSREGSTDKFGSLVSPAF